MLALAALYSRCRPAPASDMGGAGAADGGAAPNLIQRLFGRFPHLKPPAPDRTSCDIWARVLVPDADNDELAEWHQVMCDLLGAPHPAPEEQAEARPCGTPLEAAERFADWVRLCRRTGVYATHQLSELLWEHWQSENLIPIPEMAVFEALDGIPGISRVLAEVRKGRSGRQLSAATVDWVAAFSAANKRKPSGLEVMAAFPGMPRSTAYDYANRGGKIFRQALWTISPLDSEIEMPWPEMTQRAA